MSRSGSPREGKRAEEVLAILMLAERLHSVNTP